MPGSVLSPVRWHQGQAGGPQCWQVGRRSGGDGEERWREKLKGRKTKGHPPHSCFCAFLQALADFDMCRNLPGFHTRTTQQRAVTVDRAGFFSKKSFAAISQSSACVTFLG